MIVLFYEHHRRVSFFLLICRATLMMHICSRQQRKITPFRLIIIAEARGHTRHPRPLSQLRPKRVLLLP